MMPLALLYGHPEGSEEVWPISAPAAKKSRRALLAAPWPSAGRRGQCRLFGQPSSVRASGTPGRLWALSANRKRSMTDPSFYERLLAIVCNVFDAYSAVLFLPETDGPICRAVASFSLGDALDREAAIAPGHGLVGWIIREGKPLCIGNFDRSRGVLGYYRGGEEERIRAFMGYPVAATGGALCLDSRKTYSFGEKELKILSQFADLAGAYLVRCRAVETSLGEHRFYQALLLMARLRKINPKWSAFRSALLTLLAQTTGYRYCLLSVRDESGRSYFLEGASESPFAGLRDVPGSFSVGQGLVGWVFKNQTPVYSGDKETAGAVGLPLFGLEASAEAYKSVICQPIVFSRRTRAVLVLADQRSLPVTEELKAFVAMVAENLALFLENLHLRTRLDAARPARPPAP
jgi:signal transduction protein with GAF and PtsI domain